MHAVQSSPSTAVDLLHQLVLVALVVTVKTVDAMEPTFDVPIVNVTVVRGQIALLPCSIDFLGKFKVAWLDEMSIPLTYDDRRIVDDARFSIIRPAIREWNLQIRDIRLDDQGQYRCTVNTAPVKSKVVMLHVKVPAEIAPDSSSDDVTLQEGDTVVLTCNVTGIPPPHVTWYRRPSSAAKFGHHLDRLRALGTGETIVIRNVTRYSDDVYECMASNGVPPPATRHIRVTVEFAPEIQLPNRRIGQLRGKETILECVITAFPLAVNHWTKNGRRIDSSAEHRIEAYDEGDHRLTLSLRVRVDDDDDFGDYVCVASNALGTARQTMHLYEHYPDVSWISSSTQTLVVDKQEPRTDLQQSQSGTSVTGNRKGQPAYRYTDPNKTAQSSGSRAEKIRYDPNDRRGVNSDGHVTTSIWPLVVLLLWMVSFSNQ